MERADVEQVLRERALDRFGVEVGEADALASVDSLSLVELVLDLEEALGTRLDEPDLAGVTTFGELVDVVLGKGGAPA